MKEKQGSINKYSSILYRASQIYLDAALEPYGIGSGQQFFLLGVYETPGISQWQLAREGNFDEGTTARAVKKLEELEYLRRKADPLDRRMNQLFVTEKAVPVVRAVKKILCDWSDLLTCTLEEEEKKAAQRALLEMVGNARAYLEKKSKRK